jgi:hypothetical protein
MEVLMLEGDEGKKAYELYSAGIKTPSGGKGLQGRFKALIDYYKEVTDSLYCRDIRLSM